MKLDQQQIEYLYNAAKTGQIVKMENLRIRGGLLCGSSTENVKVFMLQRDNVPEFPFSCIAINQVDVLLNRMELVKSLPNFEMSATLVESDRIKDPFVRSLMLKAKGTKVDFRCANPATVELVDSFNDITKYVIPVDGNLVTMLSKGVSAVKSEFVQLLCTDNQITMRLTDINGDELDYVFDGAAEDATDEDESCNFQFKYMVDIMLPLIKAAGKKHVYISSKGILQVSVNGIDMHIMPIVDEGR